MIQQVKFTMSNTSTVERMQELQHGGRKWAQARPPFVAQRLFHLGPSQRRRMLVNEHPSVIFPCYHDALRSSYLTYLYIYPYDLYMSILIFASLLISSHIISYHLISSHIYTSVTYLQNFYTGLFSVLVPHGPRARLTASELDAVTATFCSLAERPNFLIFLLHGFSQCHYNVTTMSYIIMSQCSIFSG